MSLIALILALTAANTALPDGVAVASEGPAGPPRVLLLGDSNIKLALGTALETALGDAGYEVVRHARSVSGMARPDFFDWVSQGAQLVEQTDPDTVIIMFGGNDGQGLVPWGPQRRPIRWSEEQEWRREYRRRVATLAQELSRGGRQVFLLSPTNRRPPTARMKMRRIVDVQREALAGMDRAAWIDTFSLSSAPDGRYLATGPDERGQIVPYRSEDGIHLTRAGAAALARGLLPAMRQRGLRVDPGRS
ncbi:MAG: hypothetical protein AMXMBFR64_03380 [Myxococcales bacterium]